MSDENEMVDNEIMVKGSGLSKVAPAPDAATME